MGEPYPSPLSGITKERKADSVIVTGEPPVPRKMEIIGPGTMEGPLGRRQRKVKHPENENMDVAAPPNVVVSRENGRKAAEYPSEGRIKLVT